MWRSSSGNSCSKIRSELAGEPGFRIPVTTISSDYAKARAGQLVERMPAIIVELKYVLAHVSSRTRWNNKFKKPPAWVIKAIQILGGKNGPFGYLQQINKPGNQWTPEDMGLAHGSMQTGLMFFDGHAPAVENAKQEMPDLSEYFKRAATILLETLKQRSPHRPKKEDRLPPVQNTVQLAAYRKGLNASSTKLFEADGEPHQHALTYQILLHLWFFWPEVEEFNSVPELEAWLQSDADIHCSPKLVEKICKDIGKKFRGRGRPRKT